MFESAELGHAIDKKTYERELPKLRRALLDTQYEVLQLSKFPVIVVIGGVDGAGKGETVNLLNEWMDTRHILTHAFGEPSDEERERPPMWRFWRELPPKGKIGIFFGSWYTAPIIGRVYGQFKDGELDRRLQEVVAFEKMLTDEGALLLKFWFHLSKKRQKERLNELAAKKATRWRVTDTDWKHFELYDKFRRISEHALRETSRNAAVWSVVEGTDERYRSLTVGKALLEAMQGRLKLLKDGKKQQVQPTNHVLPVVTATDQLRVVNALDLTRKLSPDEYSKQLDKYQRKLNLLTRHPKYKKISTIAVFEGGDAAGKGGAIRRVTGALDARMVRVVPVAAPTEEERAQPYLWRFWRHLPRVGRLTIFDRSWYGRVLVERVEGFAPPSDWGRAYSEINDFEEQLVRYGVVFAKFWLQTSKEEQLRRFKEREKIGFKQFKITAEDWRNREKWDVYESALCDMIDRTSTEIAPWTLVSAEDKRWARVQVIKTLCERIEQAIG
jgi:polyphosphate:AMP phosphotransferase